MNRYLDRCSRCGGPAPPGPDDPPTLAELALIVWIVALALGMGWVAAESFLILRGIQ